MNTDLLDPHDLARARLAPGARHVYERTITGFEYVSVTGNCVRDKMHCRELPGLGLADVTSFGVSTRRTAQHLVNDDLGLYITLSGRRMVRQRGREGVAEAGEALLSDGGAPSEGAVDASRFIVFRVPRKAIMPSVAALDDKIARPIRRDSAALQLLTGYAGVLRDAQGLATPDAQRVTVKHVHDLVALALGPTRDAAAAAEIGGVRAARRQAVIDEIEANFAHADFTSDRVATKLRLSPRYVQELLQESGQSFTERVLELRLQKARDALADHAVRSVVDIALSCGFSDVSYFNRCFRRRFGDTPSGMRAPQRHRRDH